MTSRAERQKYKDFLVSDATRKDETPGLTPGFSPVSETLALLTNIPLVPRTVPDT